MIHIQYFGNLSYKFLLVIVNFLLNSSSMQRSRPLETWLLIFLSHEEGCCLAHWEVNWDLCNLDWLEMCQPLLKTCRLDERAYLWRPSSNPTHNNTNPIVLTTGVGTGGGGEAGSPGGTSREGRQSQSNACSCSNRPDYEISYTSVIYVIVGVSIRLLALWSFQVHAQW